MWRITASRDEGSHCRISEKLAFPVLADPLSQLRSGSHDKAVIIDAYDTFLRDETAKAAFRPEVILRFGAMPVSKPLLLFMKNRNRRLLWSSMAEQAGANQPVWQRI